MNQKIKYPTISYTRMVPVYAENNPDWVTSYRQVACTHGLSRQGLPELEVLLSRTAENHSILSDALREIRVNGARYAAGDRITLSSGRARYTVEMRRSYCPSGACLRIFVPGVDEEFQSLPTNMAADLVENDPAAFEVTY